MCTITFGVFTGAIITFHNQITFLLKDLKKKKVVRFNAEFRQIGLKQTQTESKIDT